MEKFYIKNLKKCIVCSLYDQLILWGRGQASNVPDGECQSIMEARFRHWIKNKNVIATFYLTILTFFLYKGRIAS